jgi:N-formylglutamate amidohydrolase
MDNTIKELRGMEAELYRYIVIDGVNISKAVEKVSEKNNKSLSTVWTIYHEYIKENLNKLKKNKKL